MSERNPDSDTDRNACRCPLGPNLGYVTSKDGETLCVCLGCHAVIIFKTTVVPEVTWR